MLSCVVHIREFGPGETADGLRPLRRCPASTGALSSE